MAYALLIEGACAARRVKRSGRPGGHERPRAVIAALLAFAAAGCFTDPINRKPQVTLKGSTVPQRKQLGTYTAQVTDPDNDQRPEKTMWAEQSGPCVGDTEERASWPPSSDWFQSMPDPTTLTFDGQTDKTTIDAPFCLWVFATDSHGAITADHLAIEPQDAAPTPVITVVAPDPSPNSTSYPLYSTIEVSYDGSTDPDDDLKQLQWNWMIQYPDGTLVTPMPCSDHDACFPATAPGDYRVTLAATDPLNKTGMAPPRTISVNTDQPPCIQMQGVTPTFQVTMPIPPPPGNTFSIDTVVDDGNPTPPGPMGWTHFRWFISSKSGVGLVPIDNDRNQLTLAGYNVGDLVNVRVEATDNKPATENALFVCGKDADICTGPQGSSCFLRLTWSILFR